MFVFMRVRTALEVYHVGASLGNTVLTETRAIHRKMDKKDWKSVPTVTKLNTIAKIAKEDKESKFTTLNYLLNKEFLLDCCRLLKKRKAAGIDGRTLESYTPEEIDKALEEVADKIHRRKYEPLPVKRVFIAKDNGRMRGLGIPTVIDKVVQLAVARILMAIFDSSFTDSSYGYRTGRDAHACLKAIHTMIAEEKVSYILDADISAFFDNIDHAWMMRCLTERINDPAFLKIIWKMLKAGVMEQGNYNPTEKGTPQGGIVSPVLSNIYLHYVLDLWMNVSEKKKLRGHARLLRYADDFIIGFQYRDDAEKVYKDIQERFKKFGLTLSIEKTKILEFGRFAEERERKRGRKPKVFTFLGFTHYCGKTHAGKFKAKVKTSSKKLQKAVLSMKLFLKGKRTTPFEKVLKEVAVKLTGHYNYYGVTDNTSGMWRYYYHTIQLIHKWMNRRSQRRSFTYEELKLYLTHSPLPKPKLTYALYDSQEANVSHRKAWCGNSARRV
jgi:group II intron reverse transcriptase/maturase